MRVIFLLIAAAAFVSAQTRVGSESDEQSMFEESAPSMEAPEEDLLSVVKELRQATDGTRFSVHGERIERESNLIQKAKAYRHSFGARNALRAAIRALVSELTSGHNHDRNALNNELNAGRNAIKNAKGRGKNVTRRYREKACPTKKAQVEAEAARNAAKGRMNAIKRRKVCNLSTSWFDMNIKGAAPKFGGELRNKWDKARADYIRKVACRKVGRYCNKHELKRVTLERNCSTLKKIFGGGACRRCSPSDSTNTYCFPGKVAGGFYHHTSFNPSRGFTCNTTPDKRVQGACPCSPRPNPQPKPHGSWYKSSTHSGTCNAVCAALGKNCNNAMIKSATLQTNCAEQRKVFGNGHCWKCGPSDSTNSYCFPGKVAGGFYYHSSFNPSRGFTCNTRPDPRITPMCPCSGHRTKAHWMRQSGTHNPNCNTFCRQRGKRCDSNAIKDVTLQSNCATLRGLFGGGACRQCSPSDSTNSYCFPGKVGGGFYFHSSFSQGRGFSCNTRPDSRVNSACPCH